MNRKVVVLGGSGFLGSTRRPALTGGRCRGLLKGWIDRVFANGWAYDESANNGLVKRLYHLKVHLIAIGGADLRTYARHGYFGAMKTQIDHGIFDFCGARVMRSELLADSHRDRFPLRRKSLARHIQYELGCRSVSRLPIFALRHCRSGTIGRLETRVPLCTLTLDKILEAMNLGDNTLLKGRFRGTESSTRQKK